MDDGEHEKRCSPCSADVVPESKEDWKNTNTVFTNEKGGMVGYDKDQVKRIVYEMSKDSPHFRNEQRKQQQTEARIQKFKEQAKKLSQQELAGHTRKMDNKISALIASRDLLRVWIHVDLDAFFASVEELEDPSLKTKPMGVGGMGMLSTTNYVARKYGVRSAMPGFIAKRLCPELVFVRPDFKKYTKASEAVRAVLQEYDEGLEAGSLDEAHLDVTEYCRSHGMTGPEVAAEMRARVASQTGLTCSCGIAPNCMLAKVCSDMNKPNGQFALPADPAAIASFLDDLSIRKVPGIGKVGEQELNALGVFKCSDIIEKRGLISALFSDAAAECLMEAGLGLGRTRHHQALREGEIGRKGRSVERTFAPIHHPHELEAKCCELAAKLAEELESEGLRGKTLTLKMKPPTFEVRTRAVTLPSYVSSRQDITAAALKLLRAEIPTQIRLMGLRMSNFHQISVPPGQTSLATFFRPKQSGEKDGEREQGAEMRQPQEAAVDTSEGGSEAAAKRESEAADLLEPSGNREDQKRRNHPGDQQGGKKLWACHMCTFAENPWHFLRCQICDERRGSAPTAVPPDASPAAEASEVSQESSNRRKRAHREEGERACPKCGAVVGSREAQEHADYHLALELDRGGRPPLGSRGAKQSKPSDARKQNSLAPITDFFRPSKVD